MIARRTLLTGLVAGAGLLARPAVLRAQGPKILKLAHQFPGGTDAEGDARDRIARRFAAELAARTDGSLQVQVYPNGSLMKTLAQFSAVRKGALDLSLVPLSYAGSELAECNLALMPGLVTSYEQAARWRDAEVGRQLDRLLSDKGVTILTWIWQSGSIASRTRMLLVPDDVKGVRIRGGGRDMDLLFQSAGAIVPSMPSNEMYIGMQTGALDAAVSSSASLISFRLDELTKNLTAGRGRSFYFNLQPLVMSKVVLDALTPRQQAIVREVGRELEAFSFETSRRDDEELARVYAKRGAAVQDMTIEHIERWTALAREKVWPGFAGRSARAAELLKLAEKVS